MWNLPNSLVGSKIGGRLVAHNKSRTSSLTSECCCHKINSCYYATFLTVTTFSKKNLGWKDSKKAVYNTLQGLKIFSNFFRIIEPTECGRGRWEWRTWFPCHVTIDIWGLGGVACCRGDLLGVACSNRGIGGSAKNFGSSGIIVNKAPVHGVQISPVSQ